MKKSDRDKLREIAERDTDFGSQYKAEGKVHGFAEHDVLKLLDYVDRLEEALRFYADNKTWLCSQDPQFGDLILAEDLEENSPITKRRFVGGKRARQALAEVEGGGE